jgi:hypothetical protein
VDTQEDKINALQKLLHLVVPFQLELIVSIDVVLFKFQVTSPGTGDLGQVYSGIKPFPSELVFPGKGNDLGIWLKEIELYEQESETQIYQSTFP